MIDHCESVSLEAFSLFANCRFFQLSLRSIAAKPLNFTDQAVKEKHTIQTPPLHFRTLDHVETFRFPTNTDPAFRYRATSQVIKHKNHTAPMGSKRNSERRPMPGITASCHPQLHPKGRYTCYCQLGQLKTKHPRRGSTKETKFMLLPTSMAARESDPSVVRAINFGFTIGSSAADIETSVRIASEFSRSSTYWLAPLSHSLPCKFSLRAITRP